MTTGIPESMANMSSLKKIICIQSSRSELGFDDRMLMLIGIPIVGVWIFLLMFGTRLDFVVEEGYLWNCLATSVTYTFIFWFFMRAAIIYLRQEFPMHKQIAKRLVVQTIILIILYFIIKHGLKLTLEQFTFFSHERYEPGALIMNMSSLTLAALIISVYEGTYFYNLLGKSIIEREKLKSENIQSQLEGLKNQVNPHFLFNSLNTLTYIIPENADRAVRFVQKLSKVYRYILEIREKKLIPLSEEMDFINSYVFLLKERFGNNLKININIPEIYLQDKIVPLSLQILFENAIKHNIISTERPLEIHVEVEGQHRIVVRNNLQKKNQVMNSTQVGLQNIKNRYRFFSDEQVEVINTADEFIVILPLIKMKSRVGI